MSTTARPATWRDVAQIMGLPVSVALRGRHAGDDAARAAWARVQEELHGVDAMFSRYRDDSWISRFNQGCAELGDAPPEVVEVLALAEEARVASHGAFDVWRGGTVGTPTLGTVGTPTLDTDGVVKGWAVHRAARHLRALPDTDFCLGGGGDLVCWTADAGGVEWQVGVEDPYDPGSLISRVPVRRGAIATSGTVHRGQHIVDARTGEPPRGVASVTVVAADLVTADLDATAAFARGRDALTWLRSRGRQGLVVRTGGHVDVV